VVAVDGIIAVLNPVVYVGACDVVAVVVVDDVDGDVETAAKRILIYNLSVI